MKTNHLGLLKVLLAIVASIVSALAEDRGAIGTPALNGSLVPPPLTVSSNVQVVVDAANPIQVRLGFARRLAIDLGTAEIKALLDFIKAPSAEANPQGIHALKNDVINGLRHQTGPVPGLTVTLLSIYQDAAQDEVMRDYAIQHLAVWYGQGKEGAETKAQIRDALYQAAGAGREATMAGTALLGLHRLSGRDESFDGAAIDQRALALVRSLEAHPAARITALQVCAERGLKAILPVVETLAAQPGSVSLRLSAIAALGRLGGAEQVGLLRKLREEKNEVLRESVGAALEQISRKPEIF